MKMQPKIDNPNPNWIYRYRCMNCKIGADGIGSIMEQNLWLPPRCEVQSNGIHSIKEFPLYLDGHFKCYNCNLPFVKISGGADTDNRCDYCVRSGKTSPYFNPTSSHSIARGIDELVDVVDENNNVLGSKAKSLVHNMGDWHRSVHLWIVNPESQTILLQRRIFSKDTNAGMLDVSVGGHVASGESYKDAWREIYEELGFTIKDEDIRELGVIRTQKKPSVHPIRRSEYPLGIFENEFCLVAISSNVNSILSYSFSKDELASVVEIRLEGFKDLINNKYAFAQEWDGITCEQVKILPNELVRQPYLEELIVLLEGYLIGEKGMKFTESIT